MKSLKELYATLEDPDILEKTKECSSEEEDVFMETVDEIVQKGDKESIPILFSYFPLVEENELVREGLFIAIESYSTAVLAEALIKDFDFFYEVSEEFLEYFFFRMMNSPEHFAIMKKVMKGTLTPRIVAFFQNLAEDSPAHAERIHEILSGKE
eukprot:g8378.t1